MTSPIGSSTPILPALGRCFATAAHEPHYWREVGNIRTGDGPVTACPGVQAAAIAVTFPLSA